MARRSDHTREELQSLMLEAGWKIVGEEGFSALTARRLAGEVGYAPGTIYNVFGSMDGFILTLNARALDELYDTLNAYTDEDPVSGMKALAAAYIKFTQERGPYWRMLFTHRVSADTEIPDWYREKVEKLFEPLQTLLKPLYGEDRAEERRLAARTLWASVHGMCMLQDTGRTGLVMDGAVERMADYLIDRFVAGL